MSEVQPALDSIEMVEVVTEARGEERIEAWGNDKDVRRKVQEKQEQEWQEQESRDLAQRKELAEDEYIKQIVEEYLERSQDSAQGMEIKLVEAQDSAQGLEVKLLEAQKRIKDLEESLSNAKKNSAQMEAETRKVQELKKEVENKEKSIVRYRNGLVLMGAEIKSLKDGKGSKLEEDKLNAAESKLKTVERELVDLGNKLKIVTGDKEYAEKSANNMENVLKTITKATEAMKAKPKSKTKCRDYNEPQGCSRAALCWFIHEVETQEGGMDEKGDCSFWLEGRCRFSDQVCRNNHNPSKKGSKSRGPKKTNQAVFGTGQPWSPPPGMVKQGRPALRLDGQNGWQNVRTKQCKKKTRGEVQWMGEQEHSAPQLEDQASLVGSHGVTPWVGEQEHPSPQLEDQASLLGSPGVTTWLGEQEHSAPQLEDQARPVGPTGTSAGTALTPTCPIVGGIDQIVQYSQEFTNLVPLLHSQYLLQLQQGPQPSIELEDQEWRADSKRRGFKRGGRRLAKVQYSAQGMEGQSKE